MLTSGRHPGAILVPQAKDRVMKAKFPGDVVTSVIPLMITGSSLKNAVNCFLLPSQQAPALSLILCSRDRDGRLGEAGYSS